MDILSEEVKNANVENPTENNNDAGNNAEKTDENDNMIEKQTIFEDQQVMH